MKLKKRVKEIEKKLNKLFMSIAIIEHDLDVFDERIVKLDSDNDKKVIERCAKIAEEFFEDDVIQGIQIAKELRDILDATPVSKKGN
jgi:hypothetical protein